MTSKSSDNEDNKPAENPWDQLSEEWGSTRIVYVIARYDKDGNQTDFEIDAEPQMDIYANYGMLVHAAEILKEVMVNGDNMSFEFDDGGVTDGEDDADD